MSVHPDTEAMTRELLSMCAPHVVAHCERAYRFATLLAAADGVELDDDVMYAGTLLHDIGLYTAGDARFEVRGANAVRAALRSAGWSHARAENTWDVIALHASTQLAAHKSPETCYSNRGVSVDVRGVGAEHLDPAAVRDVLDQFPRTDFPTQFAQTIIDEVRAHPSSARLSWLESVAAAHVPDYVAADFLSGLHQSESFR